jgi:hypothetical protein
VNAETQREICQVVDARVEELFRRVGLNQDFTKPRGRLSPEERYRYDPIFRQLVSMLYSFLGQGSDSFTPTELREAVILAASMYDETYIRPILMPIEKRPA